MNILITGGTGFVGTYLSKHLENRGDHLMILTRNPDKYSDTDTRSYHQIDEDLTPLIDKTDVIINLAGENLFDQRWTEAAKKRIRSSRINTTNKLVRAVSEAEQPTDVMISASGINYYKSAGNKELDEKSPAGDDFLAQVCLDWEDAASKVEQYGVRLVIPRLGVVLEKDDGALAKMVMAFKLFAGGPLGDGRQYFSWIHMHDLCRSIAYAIDTKEMKGPYNAVAPNPVTMNTFAKELGNVLQRPSFFRAPEFMLKLGLGESAEAITESLNVKPNALVKAGFTFEYPFVDQALKDILGNSE